ncbi:hypothetical protein GCM10010336_21900 [Streptomyces goshikiensis]|nr:hypothetical protein GCM10010336_21900 [Streptomyces goshikiensis]
MANSGASTSERETVTLLPTSAMPAIPGTRSRSAADGAATGADAETDADADTDTGAGWVVSGSIPSSLGPEWTHEQVQ